MLTRHTLALGDTGSGKTASVVLPILQGALRAPRGRFAGGLIIDPKRELAALVEREAPDRMHLLNPSEMGIDLMSGEADALAQLLREWRYRAVAQRILLRTLSFEPHLPTRVMLDHRAPDYTTNAEFWDREGTSLLLTVVAFVLMLIDRRAAPPEDWLADAEPECRWVRALFARAAGGAGERGDNVLALAAWVLDSAFAVHSVRDGSSPFGDMVDFRFGRVARAARDLWIAKGEATDVVRKILEYWLPLTETSGQFWTIVASARAACGASAEPALARTVYFGCEPGASSAYETGDAIGRAAGTDPDGPVLVYQPCDSAASALVAAAIKFIFFRCVTAHPERVRGGDHIPHRKGSRGGGRRLCAPLNEPLLEGSQDVRAGLRPREEGPVTLDPEHGLPEIRIVAAATRGRSGNGDRRLARLERQSDDHLRRTRAEIETNDDEEIFTGIIPRGQARSKIRLESSSIDIGDDVGRRLAHDRLAREIPVLERLQWRKPSEFGLSRSRTGRGDVRGLGCGLRSITNVRSVRSDAGGAFRAATGLRALASTPRRTGLGKLACNGVPGLLSQGAAQPMELAPHRG